MTLVRRGGGRDLRPFSSAGPGKDGDMSQDEMRDTGPPAASGAEDLVQQAGFIFAGTVQRLGAATMSGVPAERTAVVRVDSPLAAPALLEGYVGQDVTVRLRAPEGLEEGDEAVFFASGLVYGHSIALRELGHWPIRGNLIRLRQDVVEAQERLARIELQRRLADAVAVVMGRVVQTAPIKSDDEHEPEREHDPRWVEAVIAIDLVLRGAQDQTSVVVLFAGSRDAKWRAAPKLQVGQSGIWILREAPIEGLDRAALVLVDPRDAQPPERLGRIQASLGETG